MTHNISRYTLQGMVHLTINEFTLPEIEEKVGVLVSFSCI